MTPILSNFSTFWWSQCCTPLRHRFIPIDHFKASQVYSDSEWCKGHIFWLEVFIGLFSLF